MDTIQLNQENLTEISERISCPTYDRSKMRSGIVHIGVGGFHRSHQAYFIHRLLSGEDDLDWGITGVGLREADRGISDVLQRQDHLYTLVVQHPDGRVEAEVIGALQDFLLAVDAPGRVIDRMGHEDTRIVSMTITEGGYNFDSSTGEFNFDNLEVQHEMEHPEDPRTVYGFLTEALRRRRSKGLPPFTILSCDNIQHNGDMTRKMLLSFARTQDPELAGWIEKEVCFPNSMVDRITPVTTRKDIEYLKETYGFIDEWPVVCEPFLQWVVEDNFSNGRPAFEKVGVQFVKDVSPYEKMKIRLLNAGHSVLGIPGALHGFSTIDACMGDEVFSRFMREFMDREATPVLDPVEGIDLEEYKDSLEDRFGNPNIKDSVSRICSESSAKLPKFLIPTIRENLSAGGDIRRATLVLAAWCYYSDRGVNEKGETLEIIDEMREQLHDAATGTSKDELSFLSLSAVFGELNQNERFSGKFAGLIERVYRERDIRKLMKEMI